MSFFAQVCFTEWEGKYCGKRTAISLVDANFVMSWNGSDCAKANRLCTTEWTMLDNSVMHSVRSVSPGCVVHMMRNSPPTGAC